MTLSGCATTRIDTVGTKLPAPLCQPGDNPVTAQVFWLPRWRPDQKEPPLRDAAAERGIRAFFAELPCVATVAIRRVPGDAESDVPADAQLRRLAADTATVVDRIVLVVVRELGPRLVIGIPALVEGGTEVVIEVRVLDGRSSASLADVRTHWRHGGKFYLKGVGSLDRDMAYALHATLMSDTAAP